MTHALNLLEFTQREPSNGLEHISQASSESGNWWALAGTFSTVGWAKGSQGEAKSDWQGYGPSFGGNMSRKASDTKPRNAALRMTSSEWWPSDAMLKIRAPIVSRSS